MGKKSKQEVIRAGSTKDVKYKEWNIRYQLAPSVNSKIFKAMAVHSKSKKCVPLEAQAESSEAVLNKIIGEIDAYKGSNSIQKQNVSVAFNARLARDVVGHGDAVYASVINVSGTPVLLLSEDEKEGLRKAHNRLPDSPEEMGQQSLTLYGPKAVELGLKHARYILGEQKQFGDISGYELEFHSDVYEGEKIELQVPAVTVC